MESEQNTKNKIFPFMALGSLIYAFWYTFCLYRNNSGITYPFFIGGTCFFFFFFLKKSGRTAKPLAIFDTVSLMLLGISTCCTSAAYLIVLNKWLILLLFLHLFLHSFYDDEEWDIFYYIGAATKTLFSSLAFLFQPIIDFSDFLKEKKNTQNSRSCILLPILIGIGIAVIMLPLILSLLCSADAVFYNMFSGVLQDMMHFYSLQKIFAILAMFLFAFLASYCIMTRLTHPNLSGSKKQRTYEPVIAITFTSIFSVIYVVFCLIQIVYLFAGLGTLPENYTYAQYAREGFFQLVFICLLNLAIVLLCIRLFQRHPALQILLSVISICTFVMIASSAYRMVLYISVYHLTILRVFVLWALLVISILMAGTIVYIYNDTFPFVKFCLVVITVLYLIFSFAHPDYWIAKYNMAHGDFSYTYALSLDAIPAFTDRTEAAYHYRMLSWNTPSSSLRNWNFSIWIAKKIAGQ